MKITEKGQITIPIEFREKLGFLPNTEIEFEALGSNALKIKKKKGASSSRGTSIISKLKAAKTRSLTTDEIMAMTRE